MSWLEMRFGADAPDRPRRRLFLVLLRRLQRWRSVLECLSNRAPSCPHKPEVVDAAICRSTNGLLDSLRSHWRHRFRRWDSSAAARSACPSARSNVANEAQMRDMLIALVRLALGSVPPASMPFSNAS